MGGSLRHILITLVVLSMGFFALLGGIAWMESERTHVLVFGAGNRQGESFKMATAIARLAERHDPKLKIIVADTGGSGENVRLLEQNLLQIATIQADTRTGANTHLITALFPDSFQLLVRDAGGMKSVADLKGRSIALPSRGSGQYRSFLFLTRYYGLEPSDMELLSMSERAAEWAFLHGGVDALFRVRAPGNAAIKRIIQATNARILPIPHANALKLLQPAISGGFLPAGSYRGAPPVPRTDLPVPVVRRLLVASADVPPDLIERLTRLLYEYRREFTYMTPLAGFMASPAELSDMPLTMHEGARRYYERDKPTFLQENAEVLAFFLTIMAGVASLLLQLNARRQKTRVDAYNRELIAIYNEAVQDENPSEEYYRDKMMEIFARVLRDAEDGNLSTANFEFLSFAWDELNDAIISAVQERRKALRARAVAEGDRTA